MRGGIFTVHTRWPPLQGQATETKWCANHGALLAAPGLLRGRSTRRGRAACKASTGTQIYQPETATLHPPPGSRKYTAAGWVAALSIVAVVGTVVYRFTQQRRQNREVAEQQAIYLDDNHFENEDFKAVLTSVRQVVTFQRVVQSMRAGDTARSMVELYRVLEQNAICRTPLNTSSFSQDELEDVYRLHLHNSELPLQYSTLLHLRQLLKIADQRAEELERELKGSAYEFSI